MKTDDNVKEISSLNTWELILAGVSRHCSVPTLVTNGCLALAAVVEADGKAYSLRKFAPNYSVFYMAACKLLCLCLMAVCMYFLCRHSIGVSTVFQIT